MAADIDITYWYLTPEGWVRGGRRHSWGSDNIIPEGAVYEVQFIERVSSMYSKGVDRSTKTKILNDTDPAYVKELKTKFPMPSQ